MGFYSPGRVAVIAANPAFPSESTHVHEMAHRELCENSSFGQVTQLISLASGEKGATDQATWLHKALKECISNSWNCHEGFAVWKQFAHALVVKESNWEVIQRTLPSTYRAAAASFAINPASLIPHTSSDLPMENRRALVGVLIEIAITAIAYAAMGTPLVEQLRAEEPLTYFTLLLALRSDPPDVRLQKLVRVVTPAKVVEWYHRIRTVREPDTPLARHAEVWDEIATQVCSEAEQAFESADKVIDFASELMKRLEISRPFQLRQAKNQTIEESGPRENASHAISPILIPIHNASSAAQAAEAINKWREFTATVGFGRKPEDYAVVGEVLGEMNGITKALIHCFVRYATPPADGTLKVPRPLLEEFERRKLNVQELIGRLRQDSALHLGTVGFESCTADIYSFPQSISCRLTWLLLSPSINSYDTFDRLSEHNEVYVVDPIFDGWRTRTHQQCIEATGCSWSSTFFQKLYLHYYEFCPARGVNFARVGSDSIPRFGSKPRVSFQQACLVDTLLVGLLTRFDHLRKLII